MALTKGQLAWARRVYSQQGVLTCHFPLYTEKKGWHYCGSREEIQIHHVKPQGFIKRLWVKLMGGDGNPDYPLNLIACCKKHHLGKGYRGTLDHYNDVVPVIHTDMAYAYQRYGEEPGIFDKVFQGRVTRTERGETYWNTDWDEALVMIAEKVVWDYILKHPNDPWPKRRKR